MRPDSRSNPEQLQDQHLISRNGIRVICCNICHLSAEEDTIPCSIYQGLRRVRSRYITSEKLVTPLQMTWASINKTSVWKSALLMTPMIYIPSHHLTPDAIFRSELFIKVISTCPSIRYKDPVTLPFNQIFWDHVRSDHHKHNLVLQRSHAHSHGVTLNLGWSQATCDTSSRNSVWQKSHLCFSFAFC